MRTDPLMTEDYNLDRNFFTSNYNKYKFGVILTVHRR